MTTGTVTHKARKGKPMTHIKDGSPRYVQCYFHKAHRRTLADVWTVVFTKASTWQCPRGIKPNPYIGKVLYIGMTENGHYYHVVANQGSFRPGGSRIAFNDLTVGQRRTVIEEYEACWGIRMICDKDYIPVDWEAV